MLISLTIAILAHVAYQTFAYPNGSPCVKEEIDVSPDLLPSELTSALVAFDEDTVDDALEFIHFLAANLTAGVGVR